MKREMAWLLLLLLLPLHFEGMEVGARVLGVGRRRGGRGTTDIVDRAVKPNLVQNGANTQNVACTGHLAFFRSSSKSLPFFFLLSSSLCIESLVLRSPCMACDTVEPDWKA